MNAKRRRRTIIAAAVFVSAFWPRLVDFDNLPRDAPREFRDEAIETFWLAHDNPIEGAWLGLTVQQFRLSSWRKMACDGGSTRWPHIRNTAVTVTAIGPWGIPVARSTISCGGAAWSRR